MSSFVPLLPMARQLTEVTVHLTLVGCYGHSLLEWNVPFKMSSFVPLPPLGRQTTEITGHHTLVGFYGSVFLYYMESEKREK